MKKDLTQQKECAYILYMQGYANKDIAEKINVSERTIFTWAEKNTWKEQRAAKSITAQKIVHKLLLEIDALTNNKGAINADKIIKLASSIEKINKENNIAAHMQTFLLFTEWLTKKAKTEKNISKEFMQTIIRYQDNFINELLAHK